jgi:apolipoprotein N-acyltransferase
MADIARRSGFLRPAGLAAACVALLTLAFAPVGQFYLAWVGLAPWLILLAEAQSKKSAFFWSWTAGTAFFVTNMWWMSYISWPGMMALMIFCGLYWGCAALVIRGAGLLHGGIWGGVLGIAVVWTAFEWLRGIIFTGLPWLFLGYTQTPILAMCQVADIAGAYGVTFWVVAVNGLAATAWLNRDRLRELVPAAGVVGMLLIAVLGYGLYRMGQTASCLSAGPTVALVQANYPQSNNGEKGAKIAQRLEFHEKETIAALNAEPGKIDLVVWSETMMEALNATARLVDPDFQDVYDALSRLAANNHVAILTGGDYFGDWKDEVRGDGTYRVPEDRRNTAYLFDRDGRMDDSPGHRYDKIHLVPWGEFIPGKVSMPFLYRLSVALGPNYYTDYIMQPGDVLTVFHLKDGGRDFRFVTPICFEDIDARICSAMFRPTEGGGKRADFLVNLTNDGWFKANENAQHFQAATFRSIENRAWMARCVNTGISGFIDSEGRGRDLLPARVEGTSVRRIMIDGRLSFYTRFGDVFAWGCVGGSGMMAAWAWNNRPKRQTTKNEEEKSS